MKTYSNLRTGSIMGRRQAGLTLTPATFEAIENYLQWSQTVKRKFPAGMDMLVRTLSYVHLGYAQKYALGPVDPAQQRPELAWRLPIRRITGRYFFGWKVQRVGRAHYEMYNDSREAFFIEYGIHRNPATGNVASRRQRRPINKLSLKRTLAFAAQTAVANRVWASIYFPPPGLRSGKGFLWTMQSPNVMTSAFPSFYGAGVGIPLSNTPISP